MSNSSSSKHMRDNLKVCKESDASFSPTENDGKNVEYKDDSNIEEAEESILFEEIKLEPDNQLAYRYDENEYDIFAADNKISNVKDEVTVQGYMKKKDQKYSTFEDVKYIVSKEENRAECFIITDNVSYTGECEDNIKQSCSISNTALIASETGKETLKTSVSKDVQDTQGYSTIDDGKWNFSDNLKNVFKNKDHYYSKGSCDGNSLNSHHNYNHESIKHKCLKCHQTYNDKNCFKRHLNTAHREIIKFECNECHNTFYCKDNLQAHINVAHKGIRKFRCNACQKVFSRQKFLQIHTNEVHNIIKDFECIVCYKMFSSQRYLTRHMTVSHNKNMKKYQCNFCQRMFKKKCSILRHIATVHKKMSQSNHFTEHFFPSDV